MHATPLRLAAPLLAAALLAAPPADAGEVAQQLEDTFIAVAEQVSDAVVYLEVRSTVAPRGADEQRLDPLLGDDPGGFEPIIESAGSGIVLDADGHVLTNHHVVDGAIDIQVRLHDNRTFPGTVVGEDPDSDLAVVRIDADGLTPATFAPSEDVHIGQWAIAIGAPFGLRYSMTVGHVSARSRRDIGDLPVQDFLQTDASINPGNSGGPLVDVDGRVIGINTMIVGMGTGIGLAIPSDLARSTAATLIEHGRVLRGDAGLRLQDGDGALRARLGAPADEPGVVVAEVDEGGPGAAAGLLRGDVLTRFDGEPVVDARQLQLAIFDGAPGSSVEVVYHRGGKRARATLVLGERNPPADDAIAGERAHTGDDIGIAVEGLDETINARLGRPADAPGLLVTRVRVGSPAQRAGLEFGDVVVEAEGGELRYSIDLARAVLQADGEQVLLYVYRPMSGSHRYVLVDKP